MDYYQVLLEEGIVRCYSNNVGFGDGYVEMYVNVLYLESDYMGNVVFW